jgi:hypothetical protein
MQLIVVLETINDYWATRKTRNQQHGYQPVIGHKQIPGMVDLVLYTPW